MVGSFDFHPFQLWSAVHLVPNLGNCAFLRGSCVGNGDESHVIQWTVMKSRWTPQWHVGSLVTNRSASFCQSCGHAPSGGDRQFPAK